MAGDKHTGLRVQGSVWLLTHPSPSTALTAMFAWSLMRKCFLLKLSLRILDQLNVLIFVLPCKEGQSVTVGQDEQRIQKYNWARAQLAGSAQAAAAALSAPPWL